MSDAFVQSGVGSHALPIILIRPRPGKFHDAAIRPLASERHLDKALAPYRGDGFRNCFLEFEFWLPVRQSLDTSSWTRVGLR